MTRHYLERYKGPNLGGLVYPGEHGGHQQYGHFSKRCWRTLMKEAGLVQQAEIDGEKRLQNLYTPYSLRHFYANPHLFRDCAATSIAIDDPIHIGIASRLLGHRAGSTTERYYNQARSVEASRLLQKSLLVRCHARIS